jgi:hypothetical protein
MVNKPTMQFLFFEEKFNEDKGCHVSLSAHFFNISSIFSSDLHQYYILQI